jgi:hypothetical protein
LEHKYVKITKDRIPDIEKSKIDDLALYVDEEELYDLTMQLMHVVREAIICLSLSVHIEEQSREKQNGDKITIPVSLMEYDDSWKL